MSDLFFSYLFIYIFIEYLTNKLIKLINMNKSKQTDI